VVYSLELWTQERKMKRIKTQPKHGFIGIEENRKAHKISNWVLDKAKERESESVKKTYRGMINGKITEITFSEPNAYEKLEMFCLDTGNDLNAFV